MRPLVWEEIDRVALEHFRRNGWDIQPVSALTHPNPQRIVGYDAAHAKHGRLFAATVRDLLERIGKKESGGGR